MKFKKEVNAYAGIGIVLSLIGSCVYQISSLLIMDVIGIIIGVMAYFLIVVSAIYYARGKGYSWEWGLWGLIGVPGFIVLVLLPDQHEEND